MLSCAAQRFHVHKCYDCPETWLAAAATQQSSTSQIKSLIWSLKINKQTNKIIIIKQKKTSGNIFPSSWDAPTLCLSETLHFHRRWLPDLMAGCHICSTHISSLPRPFNRWTLTYPSHPIFISSTFTTGAYCDSPRVFSSLLFFYITVSWYY